MENKISSCLLVMVVLGCVAAARAQEPEADQFDPSQYPARGVDLVLKQNPCRGGDDVRDVPFSAQLVYGGAVRDISDKDRGHIRRWAQTLDFEGQVGPYSKEVLLRDGKSSWWMPAPESLIAPLRADLSAGDNATFYMSYMGCVDGSPVIGIEEYTVPEYEDLEEDAASYIA